MSAPVVLAIILGIALSILWVHIVNCHFKLKRDLDGDIARLKKSIAENENTP